MFWFPNSLGAHCPLFEHLFLMDNDVLQLCSGIYKSAKVQQRNPMKPLQCYVFAILFSTSQTAKVLLENSSTITNFHVEPTHITQSQSEFKSVFCMPRFFKPCIFTPGGSCSINLSKWLVLLKCEYNSFCWMSSIIQHAMIIWFIEQSQKIQ